MEPASPLINLTILIGDKMNLLQARTMFRNLSGRHDLVNADFSDNGADLFLNEGRKHLDRMDDTQKSFASAFRFIETGFYTASFPYCRAVKEVWAATTVARWQLEKMDLQDLIAGYLSGDRSSSVGNLVGTITRGVSNGTAIITAAGGAPHGLAISVGDTAIIVSAFTAADARSYVVMGNDGTNITLSQILTGSDTDLVVDFYRGTTSIQGITSGTPLYYSPTITRYIPEDAISADFESFLGWVDIPSGNVHEFNSILLNAPTSERIVVEIKGLFYSHELTKDTDENYWSAVHPLLLYMSAMRYIEVTNRNTQGVNDWSSAISTEMTQLGMDLVEELISEVSQIKD